MSNQNTSRMRRIKIFAIVSSDGFISREDGDIDWILELDNPLDTDYGKNTFFASVDTVLMNRNYYQLLNCYDLCYSHMTKPCIIITEEKMEVNRNKQIEYIEVNKNDYSIAIDRLKSLKKEKGGDIWLAGDNRLIKAFLEHDLIDEIVLTMVPVTIGEGAKLFPDSSHENKWQPWDRKFYNNGVIQVTYRTTDRNIN